MAVAKVTLNGTTLMDNTDATASADKILNTYTAYIKDGTKAVGTLVPASAPTLQSKTKSYTPTETAQSETVTADSGYDGLLQVSVSVGAISSTYVGTGITRRTVEDMVQNGSMVTAPAGYYGSSSTFTVSSGELAKPTIELNSMTGAVTATNAVSTNGYVTSAGTKSNTLYLPNQAAKTITPSTVTQTAVEAGKFTLGAVTVNPIPSQYIIPSGTKSITANGTGIDVTAYASVDVSVPSGGANMPTYTAVIDNQTGTITITCNWTYQEVKDYCLDNGKFQATLRTTQDGVSFMDMPMSVYYDASDISNVGIRGIAIYDDGLPTVEIFHTPNSNITPISPPSALAQLSVTQNGTYYPPQGKLYNEVVVNVSGGSPTIQSLTVTPSTSQQTFNASGVDGYKPVVVNAMPSGTAGTPTAAKGTVSNHAVTVTPSVTNTTGYITGGTKTGTAVSVSASELVSGTYSVTSSGTKDVTNYASISVPAGTEGTPSASKGTVSNHSISVTPSVTNSSGFITGGTKTGTAVTVSASELVSGTLFITNNGTTDATNYASVNVSIPIVTYYTGASTPASSLGTNGDIYLQTQ